jgi:hypothetical protein
MDKISLFKFPTNITLSIIDQEVARSYIKDHWPASQNVLWVFKLNASIQF